MHYNQCRVPFIAPAHIRLPRGCLFCGWPQTRAPGARCPHPAGSYCLPDTNTMTRLLLRRPCLLLILGLLLAAAGGAVSAQTVLQQIHGLVFAPDGKGLMVLAHTGLVVYRDGRWSNLLNAPHAFRALAPTRNAIYASGRRAPDAPPSDPTGLTKSTDGGLTWKQLALPAGVDFSLMAAGFQSNAVYLVNSTPDSLVAGLYQTQDDGASWQSAAALGLSSPITSIAVHPAEPRTLAMGTRDGVFVSRDSGVTFRHLAGKSVTAVLFDVGGEHVYVAREDAHSVERVSLDADGIRPLALPIASRDFITYIAQNPVRSQELAVATHLGSVFYSTNGGAIWRAIAREGRPA